MSEPEISRDLASLRALFPITQHWAYFLNGSIAPASLPVQRAIEQFVRVWAENGQDCWPYGYALFGELKARVASLAGASPDEIAITENTTVGLNMAAAVIDPPAGSNVVVNDLAWMSSTYAWLTRQKGKLEVRFVQNREGAIDLEDLAAKVDERTAAINVCHVTVGSGFRFDLAAVAEIAHQMGAYLIVDVAQSAGAVPVDLRAAGVDFAAGTFSKWLMGPTGLGWLYVRRELIERLTPPVAGWLSVENVDAWDVYKPVLHPTAMRFQGGMPNLIGIAAANAGVKLLQELGLPWVHQEIAARAAYLWQGLREAGAQMWTPEEPQRRGGFVFFRCSGHEVLYERMMANKVYVGKFLGGIRVDPSFYTSYEELDKVIGMVREHVRGAVRGADGA